MPWLNRTAKTNYYNVYLIHPLKQRAVEELIELAAMQPAIKQVIIFGSATEERCTPYSDIDVLLRGTPVSFDAPINDEAYDILWECRIPPQAEILKEIERDGVLVYDAGTNEDSVE